MHCIPLSRCIPLAMAAFYTPPPPLKTPLVKICIYLIILYVHCWVEGGGGKGGKCQVPTGERTGSPPPPIQLVNSTDRERRQVGGFKGLFGGKFKCITKPREEGGILYNYLGVLPGVVYKFSPLIFL